MKKLSIAFLLLTLTAALAISAAESQRVSRAALAIAEKSLDDRIKALWDDNPLALVGATRGIYLEGYGAVFTAEVNPISGPLALFHGSAYTKDEKDKYHKRRTAFNKDVNAASQQGVPCDSRCAANLRRRCALARILVGASR